MDPYEIYPGCTVQYIWGFPGPDYTEGKVTVVHEDGSFDADLGDGPYGGQFTNVKLANREADRGGWFKVTRPGVNR